MTNRRKTTPARSEGDALALAIERREWDRIAHYLWLTAALLLETADDATIDDLIDLLANAEGAR